MKRILSILLISVILFSCGENNKTFIDKLVDDTKSSISLPHQVRIGTLEDVLNENNNSIVFIYYISSINKLLDNNIEKKTMTDDMRDGKSKLYREYSERKINLIYRYYKSSGNNELLKEIKIKPEDW